MRIFDKFLPEKKEKQQVSKSERPRDEVSINESDIDVVCIFIFGLPKSRLLEDAENFFNTLIEFGKTDPPTETVGIELGKTADGDPCVALLWPRIRWVGKDKGVEWLMNATNKNSQINRYFGETDHFYRSLQEHRVAIRVHRRAVIRGKSG